MSGRKVRVKQRLRQLPGVSVARPQVGRRLRRSSTLRSLARRLYAIDATAPVPADVTAGKLLKGVGTESLPVVIVVIVGASKRTINAIVDDVARLQMSTAGFRPVFVSDVPAFSSVRRYGYPAELLIPASDWDCDGATWNEYASRQLKMIFNAYRATASVTVGTAGLDVASRVLLGSLGPFSRERRTAMPRGRRFDRMRQQADPIEP